LIFMARVRNLSARGDKPGNDLPSLSSGRGAVQRNLSTVRACDSDAVIGLRRIYRLYEATRQSDDDAPVEEPRPGNGPGLLPGQAPCTDTTSKKKGWTQ